MVRLPIVLILLLFSVNTFSQDTESVLRKGLLRLQGTFSFGKFNQLNQQGLYLHGNLEYYANTNISARGDLFYYLKPNSDSELELNHQLFSGASYHINTKSNFNPYMGIQPGFSVTKITDPAYILPAGINPPTQSTTIDPLVSGVFGFNYYANNWFHLFADARYVYGNHISNISSISINEFRFSFGLGFNINTK